MPYLIGMEVSDFTQEVGKRIRYLRKERGLSQERLSELAGLHPTSLSNLERGKVNGFIGHYFKLAKALDVSPADLFDVSAHATDFEFGRKVRSLMESTKKLDSNRRAVFIDAAYKLLERIDSI